MILTRLLLSLVSFLKVPEVAISNLSILMTNYALCGIIDSHGGEREGLLSSGLLRRIVW